MANEFVLEQVAADVQRAINNALNPDSTLAESGKPADAKAVGDAIAKKAAKSGWTANKYIGTDKDGNMVEKDAPSGNAVRSVNGQTGDVKTSFVVTVTAVAGGAITSDHTSKEIYDAHMSGMDVRLAFGQTNGAYQLSHCAEDKVIFETVTVRTNSVLQNRITITGGTVELGTGKATIPTTPSEVGADASGTADGKVSAHNTSEASHNDIRLLISGLNARLNAIADSDDTTLDQLSEIVAYIKANKGLIDSITTDKVNVADIINNLTTSATNKPLSAKMGVELKALIDAIKIPTSLPASDVPSWAKQPNKPSYTAKEVGAVSAADISLGIASDGLIYIFADGTPVGTGIPQGQSGDVIGYVDENNTIVLNGNLADGTYSLKYEMDNGNVVNIGNMVLDSNVYYSVTSTLTNCTNSNGTKQIVEGGSYAATITAKDGYELKSVTVTMGGSPVSVSGGNISIANVTGDIVITAVAEEAAKEPTNFFKASPTVNAANTASQDAVVLGGRLGSDNGYRVDGGPDCLLTNYIPVQVGDEVKITNLAFNALNSAMYKSDKTVIGAFQSTNTAYVTNVATSGNTQTFKIAHANAGYVRISGKPSVVKTSGAATVDVRYDLTTIVINVKRNGEWL